MAGNEPNWRSQSGQETAAEDYISMHATEHDSTTRYDLYAPAKVIWPPEAPVANRIPRRERRRYEPETWRAVLRFQPGESTNERPLMSHHQDVEQHRPFEPLTLRTQVLDDRARAQYAGDLDARRIAELLYMTRTQEERLFLRSIGEQIVQAARDHSVDYEVATPSTMDGDLKLGDVDRWLTRAYHEGAAHPQLLVCHHSVRAAFAALLGVQLSRNVGDEQRDTLLVYRHPVTQDDLPVVADRYCPRDQLLALSFSWPYQLPDAEAPIEVVIDQNYVGTRSSSASAHPSYEVTERIALRVNWLGGQLLFGGIRAAS